MTDGRIPGMWVTQPRFIEMNVNTWTVFTKAIAWANEHGTDGHVPRRYLAFLHPDGHYPDAYTELCDMGLWYPAGDGYQFSKWAEKPSVGGLGQSTAEQVEENKKSNRERQQRWREKQKAGEGSPGQESVTRYVTRDVGQGQGQGPGQGEEQQEDLEREVNRQTGELPPKPSELSGGEQHEATSSPGEVDAIDAFFREASA